MLDEKRGQLRSTKGGANQMGAMKNTILILYERRKKSVSVNRRKGQEEKTTVKGETKNRVPREGSQLKLGKLPNSSWDE